MCDYDDDYYDFCDEENYDDYDDDYEIEYNTDDCGESEG